MKAGKYYDSISTGYTELHYEEQRKKYAILEKKLPVKPNDTLLDVGCGPGYGKFECKMTGIDPSGELLKQAGFPVVEGAAEKLPFADGSFDWIVSVTAMQNFDDPARALDEMERVGKGRLAVTFLKRSLKAPWLKALLLNRYPGCELIEEDKDWICITKYK
jgi:ubiquinone/menaquinone biosynthesis C-methylase UbiE